MLNKAIILNRLKEEKPFLSETFYVKAIGLFGSFARNEATANSDIDLLVELFPLPEKYIETKEALRAYLSSLFGRNVDIANPRSLKPHFKERILKQAVYA